MVGMTIFRLKFDRNKYDFRDRDCIGRSCWQPGLYQVRGATSSGSRATGTQRPCCMRRAYNGCPSEEELVVLPTLVEQRKKEGWKIQR